VGEEAVALEGGGGGPRVHREGQPPRQLDRHGLSLLHLDDGGFSTVFSLFCLGGGKARITLACHPK
jgi:hypothetical protein